MSKSLTLSGSDLELVQDILSRPITSVGGYNHRLAKLRETIGVEPERPDAYSHMTFRNGHGKQSAIPQTVAPATSQEKPQTMPRQNNVTPHATASGNGSIDALARQLRDLIDQARQQGEQSAVLKLSAALGNVQPTTDTDQADQDNDQPTTERVPRRRRKSIRRSRAMKASWDSLSAKARKTRIAAMVAGRKANR